MNLIKEETILSQDGIPTEIWVIAVKRKDGRLPTAEKITGHPSFWHTKEEAEHFLNMMNLENKSSLGVFRAWITIKGK